MARRFRSALLSEADSETYDKLAGQENRDELLADFQKFAIHLESAYPIRSFHLDDYDPVDRFGNEGAPVFYGETGYHAAEVYLFICAQLSLSEDSKVGKKFSSKFYDFCWHEIGRIEDVIENGTGSLRLKVNILFFLDTLIAVAYQRKDDKEDKIQLIRGYTKFCEYLGELETLKLWPQSQQRKAAPYYKLFEGVVNNALELTKYPDLVTARHPKVIKAFTQAIGYALDDEPCLIVGETGTGKELIARAIHAFSLRRGNNFRAVSCAGFTPTMFNAEIQGVLKGYATNIIHTRLGVFLDACGRGDDDKRYGYRIDKSNEKYEPIRFKPLDRNPNSDIDEKKELKEVGGTVFLDEISYLDLSMQAALLRIVQESAILVQGENTPRKFYVKLICAGNIKLTNLIASGLFLEDLYFRIHKGYINVPSLRELKSSFEEIIISRIDKICEKIGLENKIEIARDAMRKLKAYDWPGNMRQLENVLYRSLKQMQVESSNTLKSGYIEELINKPPVETKRDYNGIQYKQLIKEYLQDVYEKANKNQSRAAENAGLERLEFRRKLIKYQIVKPKEQAKKINEEKEKENIKVEDTHKKNSVVNMEVEIEQKDPES
jgi:DNA-binding NtrC family response regulator